jgi:transcriptional regulator with XRE-family HTH domain
MPNGSDATPNEQIGANIGAALQRLGVSNGELARRMGVDVTTIGRFVRGELNITSNRLVEIAEALGMKAGELLPAGHSCTAGA